MGILRICLCEDISSHSLKSEIEVMDIEMSNPAAPVNATARSKLRHVKLWVMSPVNFGRPFPVTHLSLSDPSGNRNYIVVVVVYEPVS